MPKPHVLASGIVEPSASSDGAVVAIVAVNFGVEGSRLFKVTGSRKTPTVSELPGATTIDLGLFRREVEGELGPVAQAAGGPVSTPDPSWVCGCVRQHLLDEEGVDIDG